ncbi:MAG: hypothetical protein QXY40_11365 [Candidatus Methanomethylicia archaeon]
MGGKLFKEIATEIIRDLLNRAEKIIKEDKDLSLAKRYAKLALDISTKCRIKLSYVSPHIICKKCETIMIPGKTCTIRIRSKRFKHLVITCLVCGRKIRKPVIY